jgi:hypothetical protein
MVMVVLDSDGAHGNEKDAAHQVDEELQGGQVRAQQVGHQHSRHDHRVPAPYILVIFTVLFTASTVF